MQRKILFVDLGTDNNAILHDVPQKENDIAKFGKNRRRLVLSKPDLILTRSLPRNAPKWDVKIDVQDVKCGARQKQGLHHDETFQNSSGNSPPTHIVQESRSRLVVAWGPDE